MAAHGERGLMQVSEIAANEWARENKVAGFNPDQLFEPKTNLEAGSWYLHRAMEHWNHQSDPTPFALAEYNAGASSCAALERWKQRCRDIGTAVSAKDRFSRNAQIRRVDYRPLQILSAPRADVTRDSVPMVEAGMPLVFRLVQQECAN